MIRNITTKTELFCFLGDPAEHSRSPLIYNTAFEALDLDCIYIPFKAGKESLPQYIDFIRRSGIRGANISMPNKNAIIPLLDHISESAAICGAVNTVINDHGKLNGYNTDAYGAAKALSSISKTEGAAITVLGLGGAGRAAVYGCSRNKASKINIFLRSFDSTEAIAFADKIRNAFSTEIRLCDFNDDISLKSAVSASNALINATDIGMGKKALESPIKDDSVFHKDLSVMDMIYEPRETKFMRSAREAGCRNVINGLPMLLFQAEKAFEIFTGLKLPAELIESKLFL